MEPGFVPRIVLALQIDVREIQWQLNVRDKFPSPGLGVWRKSPDVSLRFFTPGTWQVGGGASPERSAMDTAITSGDCWVSLTALLPGVMTGGPQCKRAGTSATDGNQMLRGPCNYRKAG